MKYLLTYIITGCLMGSLFFSACGEQEELLNFEKVLLERPLIEEYVTEQGLIGTFTSQGVFVVIEAEGDTATSFPTSSSFVDFIYTGSLLNGIIFSKTETEGLRTPGGELPQLSSLISGLETGLKLFRKGGKGTLIIPSPLAYEKYGSTDGKVPPNAILRFDFTLLDFE